ncbi:MerR family transcriptional regulator [Nocardioides humi]|uniref:HTH merR-type domain-containing protein n=1 Tax=Nocardioides humi TaxID=449461 RepID=A0ABN2AQV5_9ACTN|nr:MerR family transcriptional regulator [Nocardioides humi]
MSATDVRDATLSIAEVARRAGVTTNAVRYYERYGVVQGQRTSGNIRRFTIDAVCRIKLARAAQRVGLTLRESAEILADIPPLCPDLDKWMGAGRQLVSAGQERIAELEAAVDEFRAGDFLRS